MEKHIHKYVRIKVGKNKRIEYRCILPGCTHVKRGEYILFQKSICNRCGNVFIIEQNMLKLAKPHCNDCTKTRVDLTIPDDVLAKIGDL